jgi:hypothetical protein
MGFPIVNHLDKIIRERRASLQSRCGNTQVWGFPSSIISMKSSAIGAPYINPAA